MTSICTRQILAGFCRTCKWSNIYFLQLFFNFTTLCMVLPNAKNPGFGYPNRYLYQIEYYPQLIIIPFLPLGQLSDTISSVRKGCQSGCNNMVSDNSNIVRGVNGKIVHSETYQGTQ